MTIRSYKDFCTKKQNYQLNDYKELEIINALVWSLRQSIDSAKLWLTFDAEVTSFVLGNNQLVDLPRLRSMLMSARSSFEALFKPHCGPLAGLNELEERLANLLAGSYAPQLLSGFAEFVMLFEEHIPRSHDDFYENDEFWPDFDDDYVAIPPQFKELKGVGERLFAKCLLYPQEVTLEEMQQSLAMVYLPDVVLLYPAEELALLQEMSVTLEAALLLVAPRQEATKHA